MRAKQYSIEQVRETMDNVAYIRNLSVIAHVDHGKTTLTDSLAAAAGLINRANTGDALVTSTRPDEKARGITIKSTGIAIYVEVPRAWCSPPATAASRFLLNLVDSPGHVDFSSEVTAALRVTDGALVVIDCIEGVCVQTRTVLGQALDELVKPVLVLNKLDRCFLEKRMDLEDIYQSLCRSIESVNVVLATHRSNAVGQPLANYQVDPLEGTVVFASAKQAWGFSLATFAEMYFRKKQADETAVAQLTSRLWGDHFWDVEQHCWSVEPKAPDGRTLIRGFCHFVLAPLQRVLTACERVASAAGAERQQAEENLQSLLSKIDVGRVALDANKDDTAPATAATASAVMRTVMQQWIPADQALIRMIVRHLPSPAQAQRYRADHLYTGPCDDITASAIRACDPKGPLCVYISKLVPDSISGARFYAFGRVFSGTVRTGQRVCVLGSDRAAPPPPPEPGQQPRKREDYFADKSVLRVVVPAGKQFHAVADVPAGNTVALVGLDQYILKNCTVATDASTFPIAGMSFAVAPVVRVAVEPRQPSQLPRFVQALQRLSKTDQLVQCSVAPTGEHIVAAAGELHLEVVLHDLLEMMLVGEDDADATAAAAACVSAAVSSGSGEKRHGLGGVLVVSEPVVSLTETVSAESSQLCMAKSPNRFNRVYVRAAPLGDSLCAAIEAGEVTARDPPTARSRVLVERFGWDVTASRRLWSFGPNSSGPNMLVDATKAVQYLREAQDSITAAFQWMSSEGPLCGEPLRAVRFDLCDLVLHSDTVHRSGAQLIPAAKRVFAGAVLTAQPRLCEPLYLASVTCPRSKVGSVYSVLTRRRGRVQSEEGGAGTEAIVTVLAHLPVLESFGLTAELRAATAGQAFPQLAFSHWQSMPDDPLAAGSRAAAVVTLVRTRKGMHPPDAVPTLDKFLDTL
eukprot:TRINITY_DN3163_c1_g2_i1.p1 TRINITY_DN3163_c1_g2~~TRINITY_DN3163_c1_g2_i1.p1  ORF type:complete len:916 (-),score=249.24 TRINITY_DN3163_c1_g2_i1:70-2817(-)